MKILVPVDGSPASLEAVRQALRMVQGGLRASLVLANVQEPATLYEMLLAHDPEVIEKVSAEAGLHLLEPARALVREAGVEHEIEVAAGDPAHTLIDVLENFGCDMVVMGARGLGTLAQRDARLGVARGAACRAGAGAHRQASAAARGRGAGRRIGRATRQSRHEQQKKRRRPDPGARRLGARQGG